MEGYRRIGLKQLLCLSEKVPERVSLEKLRDFLSAFSYPFPNDVEDFLRIKAIEFEKQIDGGRSMWYISGIETESFR